VRIELPKAGAHKIRFALASAVAAAATGGPAVTWTFVDILKTKPATPINNLTPGMTYMF
jgi:hypothetical protein